MSESGSARPVSPARRKNARRPSPASRAANRKSTPAPDPGRSSANAIATAFPLPTRGMMLQPFPAAGSVSPGRSSETATSVLVDDDAAPGERQVIRTEFLARLEARLLEVCNEELAEAGRSADTCPYLHAWLDHYAGRPATEIESTIHRYARPAEPTSEAFIAAVADRVRAATRAWVRSRSLTAIREFLPNRDVLPIHTHPPSAMALRPGVAGAPDRSGDIADVRDRLDGGVPLPGAARTRMEAALGDAFGDVRIHTGAVADRLSAELSARAFTIGTEIAFGDGEFRPGTPYGDALLAHELAHVRQQRGVDSAAPVAPSDGARNSLEFDANLQAASAVGRLWGVAEGATCPVAYAPSAKLHTGPSLLRCGSRSDEEQTREAVPPGVSIPVPEEPRPDPRDAMKEHLRVILADRRVTPDEWQSIHERSEALGLADSDVRSVLSFEFDIDGPAGELAAIIGTSSNPVVRELAQGYTASIPQRASMLSPDPLPRLVSRIVGDSRVERTELDALRSFSWSYSADEMRTAFSGAGVSEATADFLFTFSQFGYGDYEHLVTLPGFLPITLETSEGGLAASRDLRIALLRTITRQGEWRQRAFAPVRSVLGQLTRADAAALLVSAGFEEATASTIAGEFTRPAANYESWVAKRTQLSMRFEMAEGQWRLTDESRESLALPWHPTLVRPLAPVGGEVIRGEYTVTTAIGQHTFASGMTTEAERLTLSFRGHTMSILSSSDLLTGDADIFDRIDIALSLIPPAHIQVVQEIVLDPGNHPDAARAADASREGRVNLYFNRVGPNVPQNELNQTTVHEFGHLLSYEAERNRSDFWERWEAAMASDRIAISRYGTTSSGEDFAETYVLYLSGGRTDATVRARYPARFALMDSLFPRPGQ